MIQKVYPERPFKFRLSSYNRKSPELTSTPSFRYSINLLFPIDFISESFTSISALQRYAPQEIYNN